MHPPVLQYREGSHAPEPIQLARSRVVDCTMQSESAAAIGPVWGRAHDDPDTALILVDRDISHLEGSVGCLIDKPPFATLGSGTPSEAVAALGFLPRVLAADILDLATRFDDLMKRGRVRIRLELVTTNSCRKIHSDYTDLRLITTYSGPGTQVLPTDAEKTEANLWSMPTGWIGLFKGRLFGEGHAPCFHRSPPAGDLGLRRLVLVIDTPASANRNRLP